MSGCAGWHEVVIVGGGQAGLALGHELARRGIPFVVLEAAPRIGDSWRARWDSLALFTPRAFSSLPGLPFPPGPGLYPTKDEVADYLERYAAAFALPVQLNCRVTAVRPALARSVGWLEGANPPSPWSHEQRGRTNSG